MRRDGPLVSVGMPVYNGGESVLRALNSILNQTYKNIEVILADDASTDNSVELIEEVIKEKHNVTLIKRNVNCGAVANFSSVLNASKGKYFMWMAQDDYRESEYVDSMVRELERDDNVSICHSMYRELLNGKELRRVRDLSRLSAMVSSVERFRYAYTSNIGSTAFYGLIRVDALRKTDGWVNYPGSDVTLFNELMLIGRYKQVNKIMFDYSSRIHVRDVNGHLKFLSPGNKRSFVRIHYVFYTLKNLAFIARQDSTVLQLKEKTGLIGFILGIFVVSSILKLLYLMARLLGVERIVKRVAYKCQLENHLPLPTGAVG